MKVASASLVIFVSCWASLAISNPTCTVERFGRNAINACHRNVSNCERVLRYVPTEIGRIRSGAATSIAGYPGYGYNVTWYGLDLLKNRAIKIERVCKPMLQSSTKGNNHDSITEVKVITDPNGLHCRDRVQFKALPTRRVRALGCTLSPIWSEDLDGYKSRATDMASSFILLSPKKIKSVHVYGLLIGPLHTFEQSMREIFQNHIEQNARGNH